MLIHLVWPNILHMTSQDVPLAARTQPFKFWIKQKQFEADHFSFSCVQVQNS